MRKKLLILAPLATLGLVLFVLLGGGIVMLLWNWLAPALFGLRELTFWQALGLLALCRILFGRTGMPGPVSSRVRRRAGERCENMTPEERERVRRGLRARWGFGSHPGEGSEK